MTEQPYYRDDRMQLLLGDCIEVMADMEPDSIDAIIADPPYGLEFMGKEWDRFADDGKAWRRRKKDESDDPDKDWGVFNRTSAKAPHLFIAGTPFQAWCTEWAREALRVAKPGAYLLAFGGTRTYHRLAVAIEDAGWEIRDCLVWAYASGFPKSLDVSKAIDKAAGAEREVVSQGKAVKRMIPGADQDKTGSWIKDNGREFVPTTSLPSTEAAQRWDGWGTALKPAWEPIIMARKPFDGTVADNVQQHGTGALNIDATRISYNGEADPSAARKAHGYSEAAKKALGGATVASENASGFSGEVVGTDSSKGRWPANLILTDPILDGDYPEEVVGGGSSTSGTSDGFTGPYTAAIYGQYAQNQINPEVIYGDTGGKSRFFLIPKADRQERERGLAATSGGSHAAQLTAKAGAWLCACGRKYAASYDSCPKCGEVDREWYSVGIPGRGNTHPTVKPLDLMKHLVRLVTQPNGLILDPFIGSGTTALAASEEGFRCIGIDKEQAYLDIAIGRLVATPIGMGL